MLPGYIDPQRGEFNATHKNMDIIINLANGMVSERVCVPELPNLTPDNGAITAIGMELEKHGWELQSADDKNHMFFYRQFQMQAYPTTAYMEQTVGFFEWFFHKHDVYNINGVPF